MKDRKLSFSPCSIVNRLDEEPLCLCPPIKLLTNNLLNSSKEPTVFGGILLNHTRAGPLRVGGKALHIILPGTLKVHCGLEGCNVVTWVACSIIRIQGRHLELGR